MKTLQNLEEGDVVENKLFDKSYIKVVMYVLKPGLYVMSEENDPKRCGIVMSATDLDNGDYERVNPERIKFPEEPREIVLDGVKYREVL